MKNAVLCTDVKLRWLLEDQELLGSNKSRLMIWETDISGERDWKPSHPGKAKTARHHMLYFIFFRKKSNPALFAFVCK